MIPTRDRGRLLAGAVASVLGQQHVEIAVAVIDDGSVDPVRRTGPLADERVCLLRNDTPLGPAAARNQGVDALDVRWIGFLDDDDQWHPEKASVCLDALERLGVGVAVHRSRAEDAAKSSETRSEDLVSGGARSWLVRQPPHVDCVLVSRELHCKVRFDEAFPAAADLDYMVRLADETPFVFIDRVLAVRAAPASRLSHVALDKRIAGRKMFREKHATLFGPAEDAFFQLRLGHLNRRAGRRVDAARSFVSSFRAKPSSAALRGLATVFLPEHRVRRVSLSRH